MAEKRTYSKKENISPIPANEYGKLPPQALELEEDVLGAIMVEKNLLLEVSEIINPNDFYKIAHQKIFEAILELYREQNPIDMHTVTEQCRKNGTLEEIGGAYYITLLTSRVSSGAHAEYHSAIIKQKSIARELIRFTSEFQAKAFDDKEDIDTILDEAEKQFTEIRMDGSSRGIQDMKTTVDNTRKYLLELRRLNENGNTSFLRTPVKELNEKLKGGFKNKKLVIVGARPRMGKTQFILETAKKNSDNGYLALFNLEMDAVELAIRLLLEEDAIDDYSVEAGTFTNDQLKLIDKKLIEIEKMNMFIVDDEYNLHSIISKCRKLKREHPNLKGVFIDYLQLIETGLKFQTRDIEVGYITRKLKQLAKDLDLPIILLAQLNRDAKNEPTLENLRESGNIEQDADIVILIDRPILRDIDFDKDDNTSWEDAGQFIVAKHRQGSVGKVKFSHDKRFKRMFSYVNVFDYSSLNQQSVPKWRTEGKPF